MAQIQYMAKPVQESLQAITTAKNTVNKLLTGTEHVNQLLEINGLFRRLETRLQFMGAVTEPETFKAKTSGKEEFPPITSFMGEKIVREKKISSDDLNPDETRKANFRDKVNKLYGTILNLTPHIVLNSYTMADDILVLRGVAKLAGIEDYKERELTAAFVEDIKKAIADKDEETELLSKVKGEAGKTPDAKQPILIKATKQQIEASEYLKKHGVKPGDEVLQHADGKYELKLKA